MAYQIILEELPELIEQLKTIATVEIKNLENKLEEVKAPWTPGRIPVMN